jgi:hypothetical protein
MPAKGQDILMPTSIFLAKLIGPLLVLTGVSLLANRKSFEALLQEALRGTFFVYFLGLIDFAVGLAIVLTHNVWTADWRVIITILGWFLIVRGVIRTLLTDHAKAMGTKLLHNKNATTVALAVTLVLGAVLSYFGYAR